MGNPATMQRIDEWLQRRMRAFASMRDSGPGHIRGLLLGDDPPVILLWDYEFQRTLKSRPDFWAALQGRPSLVVLLRSWEIRSHHSLGDWPVLLHERRRDHPEQRVVYTANVASELPVLEAAGIETLWFNANALVDERVFMPHPDAAAGGDREFDAIYDARFSRFKRHYLAAKVRRLALIHYASPYLIEPLWDAGVRCRLWHARILNRGYLGYWPVSLSPAEVSRANNRAHVGLCLSAVEGAMLASIQYLLCGLPVVTTPSRGGRDVFFDANNSLVVTPEPNAVAAGVRELIARKIDPWTIRARTIG